MRIPNFVKKLKIEGKGNGVDLTAPWKVPHNAYASEEDIFFCFRLLLGRSPNREEWRGHASHAGDDLDSVVASYLGSLEFSRRLSALTDRKPDERLFLAQWDGFSIYINEDDAAVGQAVKAGSYEPHVTAVIRDRLKAGMNVLDIGANIGYFTMLAASLVKSSGSVMAIEPNPQNVRLLEASRRVNSFENVVVVQAAANHSIGLLSLNTSYSNGTTASPPKDLGGLIDSNTVLGLAVDDLVRQDKNIDFVKIDVEGAELNALRGASEMIRRCHPTIASEFAPDMMPNVSGTDGPEYLQFLLSFGYKISLLELDGRITPCGSDITKVMDAYFKSGVDHIDILLD